MHYIMQLHKKNLDVYNIVHFTALFIDILEISITFA
jgi:hypothetical protein